MRIIFIIILLVIIINVLDNISPPTKEVVAQTSPTKNITTGHRSTEIVVKKTMTEEEKEAATKNLVAELKKIPAHEYKRNLDRYMKLVEYNPDVKRYQSKVEHYQSKYDVKMAKEQKDRDRRNLSDWYYGSYTDKMTSKTAKYARVTSQNSINLDFPYRGLQKATLTVRKHPRYGRDMYLEVKEGQILCDDYSHTRITVKFGENAPVKFRCQEPSDNSSTIVFFRGYSRFVKNVKKVNTVKIQIEFYQNGPQVFEFKTRDLIF